MTSNHQPLEVQLQRDPQIQIDVERVVMRDERPRRRAAGDRVQHRSLRLDVALLAERLPYRADDSRPLQQSVEHPLVVDHVDVTVPQEHLDVARTVKLLRRSRQRFAQQRELFDENRLFAGLGDSQPTVDSDDVAKIELLDRLPRFLRHVFHRDHQLDAAGRVLNVKELQLATIVLQHDPARDANSFAIGAEFGRTFLTSTRNRHVPIKPLSPGIEPKCLQPVQLFQTSRLQAMRLRRRIWQ